VSEPRIGTFARLANGNVKPSRIIWGRETKLSRTMHGLYYDAKHDEVVVPVALAGAVLSFRGDFNGQDAPIRVLQGPKTRIQRPDTLYVDPIHDEVFVDQGDTAILVFDRTASGDVPPKRVIEGKKTLLRSIFGVAVDPVRNLLLVANRSEGGEDSDVPDGVLVFNRTDEGDVAPRAIIAGPLTGILRIRQLEVDPERGLVFVAVKNNFDSYNLKDALPGPWNPDRPGFIGIWNVTDNGNVAPRGVIKGPATGLIWPAGVAINPAASEVYAIDSVSNGLTTYYLPELFSRPGTTTTAAR
jgi:hypothetical protein